MLLRNPFFTLLHDYLIDYPHIVFLASALLFHALQPCTQLINSGQKPMTLCYMYMPTSRTTKTILLVDDEQENLRTYQEILEDMDYCILTRSDADSALALLREEASVDLIVTDYRMPGKNGLEFVTELRRFRPFVPVIMITAYGNIETYLQSVSLGVFEYVHKPIKKEELELIVKQALHDDELEGMTEDDRP